MWKAILFFSITAVLIAVYFGRQKTLTKKPSELNPQYDYIIVGGGAAGAVLAARLSENPTVSVLVLEAGSEETDIFYSHIPGAVPYLQGTDFDWAFQTVPQTHCCNGLVENTAKWPRGKCLGGTSVLNYMHYVRGHPSDYDDYWVPATQDDSWSSKNLLRYFKKSESIQIDAFKTSKYHGTDGPLPVSFSLETKLGSAYLEALRQKGHRIFDDLNGPNYEGFARVQTTINNGKRASAASTYLRPAMTRSNLAVVIKAHCTKVLFNHNDDDKRAVGVEYVHDGKIHRVLTNKEIILSAGAIGSPHILLLSGIGDKEQLEEFGIPVVHELPAVGKNLLDHVFVHTILTFNESIGVTIEEMLSPWGQLKSAMEYFLFGTGPLSNTGMELTGFIKTGLSNDTRPDLQLYMFPLNAFHEDLHKIINMKPEVQEALQAPVRNKPLGLIGSVLLHPGNTGEIRLQSVDSNVPARIDPKYLQNDLDVDVMVAGLKLMIDAALTAPALQRYNASLSENPMPGCEQHKLYSDDYWRCVVRNRVFTVYHPVSTCRMGSSPEDSVVDKELRVHGIKGLRVVDASAFPDQVSGNPYAVIVMLAEKAADMIKRTSYS